MPTSRSAEPQLDIEVLKQFRIIFKSVRRHFQSVESACGVSGSQLWALAKIAETGGIRVTELSKAMAIHQSTASNLIEKLVEKRLVTKSRDPENQRAVRVLLTPEGQAIVDRAPGPYQGLLPDALGRMPYGELRDLRQNLDRLLSLMDHLEAEAGNTPLSDVD